MFCLRCKFCQGYFPLAQCEKQPYRHNQHVVVVLFHQTWVWANNNDHMVGNLKKTTEIVTGPQSKTSHLPLFHLSAGHINSVKLLDINLDANFLGKSHVEAFTSKATRRLYFLKQLRRAGVRQAQLIYFHRWVIRPVLKYAAPVWNRLLT